MRSWRVPQSPSVPRPHDIAVRSVQFTINGADQPPDTESPYTLELDIPPMRPFLTIGAKATDSIGKTTTANRIIPVLPNPQGGEVVGSPISILNRMDAPAPAPSALEQGEVVGPPVSVLNIANPSQPAVGETNSSLPGVEQGEVVGPPISILNRMDAPAPPAVEQGDAVGPVLSIENKVTP